MRQFFDHDYDGGAFALFGTGHLVYLAIMAAGIAFLAWGWRDPGEQAKRRARLLIATVMLVNEIAWHAWNLAYGAWSIRETLPLHLCGISIWTTIYMLYSRDYRLFEIFFFISLVGASQPIITPSAGEYGLPHFRAFQTLVSHGMVVFATVFIAAVEGCRPRWISIAKTMLALNVYLLFLFGVNTLLGSNYMYTMEKPGTASLLDYLGPWPWYLLGAEVLAAVLCVLVYLPIAWSDRRN